MTFNLAPGDTVVELKRQIEEATRVDSKRQKLIGLKTASGKPALDETAAADLLLKPGQRIMLMGAPEVWFCF